MELDFAAALQMSYVIFFKTQLRSGETTENGLLLHLIPHSSSSVDEGHRQKWGFECLNVPSCRSVWRLYGNTGLSSCIWEGEEHVRLCVCVRPPQCVSSSHPPPHPPPPGLQSIPLWQGQCLNWSSHFISRRGTPRPRWKQSRRDSENSRSSLSKPV